MMLYRLLGAMAVAAFVLQPAIAGVTIHKPSAHSIIIVDKRGTHLAHEIRHACDREWRH